MRLKRLLNRAADLDYKYLLLELIIVICGILIAFWIDTAWDNRSQEKKIRNYLSAFEIELNQTMSGFEKNLEVYNADIRNSTTLLEHINKGAGSISEDSLFSLLWQLRPPEKFLPRKAVLDDFLRSGVLSQFDSELFRRSVASYTNALEQDNELQTRVQEEIRDQILVVQVPHIDLSEIIPDSGLAFLGNKSEISFPEMKFGSNPENLFNRDFANYLFNRINLVSSVISSNKNVLSEIESGLLLINTMDGSGEKPINIINDN